MRGALSLVLLLGGVNAACVGYRPPPAAHAPDRTACRATHRRRSGPCEPAAGSPGDRAEGRHSCTAPAWTARSTRWIWRPARSSGPAGSRAWWRAACSSPATRSSSPARGPRAGCTRSIGPPASGSGGPRPGRWGPRWRWSEAPSWCRRSGASCWASIRRTARFAGDGAWGWPGSPRLSVGRGAVVVATVDSLYRLTVADGEVTHRVRSPGTIVSPWLVHRGLARGGHHRFAGRRRLPRGPQDPMERQGGRPRAGLARRRWAIRFTSPAGGARSSASSPATRRCRSGSSSSTGRSPRP